MKFTNLVLILFLVFSIIQCDNSSSKPNSKAVEDLFEFITYGSVSQQEVNDIAEKLDENYQRILDDLQTDITGNITVKIWADRSQFMSDMERDLGIRYEGATGYLFSRTEIRILHIGDAPQTVHHEFAHVALLFVNPNFSNNPRWLWEAVALYESGEFIDPKDVNFMYLGDYPTIEELDMDYNDGVKIYRVGYVLLEYIIETWGMEKVIELINSNGDLENDLGVTVANFEQNWYQYIEDKYLSEN